MPSEAAVIRYEGKRGVVWRIKYADATGRQVMETLGPEREGWTERRLGPPSCVNGLSVSNGEDGASRPL